MNTQKRLFKLVLMVGLIFLLTIIFYPVSYLGIMAKEGSWKYGFQFISPSSQMALFSAFALAFVAGLYHSLSFERFTQVPLSNYLKTNQRKTFKGTVNTTLLGRFLEDQKDWTIVDCQDDRLELRTKNRYFSPDVVIVEQRSDQEWTVLCRPFVSWIILDNARNYKHLITVFLALKDHLNAD